MSVFPSSSLDLLREHALWSGPPRSPSSLSGWDLGHVDKSYSQIVCGRDIEWRLWSPGRPWGVRKAACSRLSEAMVDDRGLPHRSAPKPSTSFCSEGRPARNSLSLSVQLSVQGPWGASSCPFQILPTSLTTHALVTNRPTQAANSNKFRLGAGCTKDLSSGRGHQPQAGQQGWAAALGTQAQASLPGTGQRRSRYIQQAWTATAQGARHWGPPPTTEASPASVTFPKGLHQSALKAEDSGPSTGLLGGLFFYLKHSGPFCILLEVPVLPTVMIITATNICSELPCFRHCSKPFLFITSFAVTSL